MSRLQIAEGLSLPLDVVTQTVAILAKRRAGKSYTARRIAEQLLHARQQVVIVDPKGDHWGIRSARDGRTPGFSVTILGGERGDLPLEVDSGPLVAKLAAEDQVNLLLDLSLFRKHQVATFMAGFLENLYRLKAREAFRTPMMLVVDEADAIAPQKPQKGEERMLGAADDIVRRGGQRGIGCALVTQRSAVLNKNVLTQAQMLVVLRTIAPQDIKAMEAWIEVHGTKEQGARLIESLPSLPIGDAWFWSPGWPTETGIFKRVHVLPIETFDSGATPKPGERRVEPKNVADVDLEVLKKQMAATVEKAKREDPKLMQRRIAELERDNAQLRAAPAPVAKVETKRVEVSVVKPADLKRAEKLVARLEDHAARLSKMSQNASEDALSLATSIEKAQRPAPLGAYQPMRAVMVPGVARPDGVKIREPKPFVPPVHRASPSTAAGSLGKAERAILCVLAQHPQGCVAGKLALLSGYRWSGGFRNSLASLRTSDCIVGLNGGTMQITDVGLTALGSYDPLPRGEALIQYWLTHPSFGTAERSVLSALVKLYPKPITGPDLAKQVDREWSGGFRNVLSSLRTAGVIVGTNMGGMTASEDLFS